MNSEPGWGVGEKKENVGTDSLFVFINMLILCVTVETDNCLFLLASYSLNTGFKKGVSFSDFYLIPWTGHPS